MHYSFKQIKRKADKIDQLFFMIDHNNSFEAKSQNSVPEQKKAFNKSENEAKDLFQQESETCSSKFKKRLDELTDRAANFLQCTRLFSKQRLQQLKTVAKNLEESAVENQSIKSVPSNISKMSTKQDFKNSEKDADTLSVLNQKQLPLKNYGMTNVQKFYKRYSQDFSESYSERSKRFQKNFDQVQKIREEQYERKAKTFWGELKRLLLCYGGNYVEQIQEGQVNAPMQNLDCSYILRKRQPSLNQDEGFNNNNIFLAQSLALNEDPPEEIKLGKNGKRKIRTNLKLVDEKGQVTEELGNRQDKVNRLNQSLVKKNNEQKRQIEQKAQQQYRYQKVEIPHHNYNTQNQNNYNENYDKQNNYNNYEQNGNQNQFQNGHENRNHNSNQQYNNQHSNQHNNQNSYQEGNFENRNSNHQENDNQEYEKNIFDRNDEEDIENINIQRNHQGNQGQNAGYNQGNELKLNSERLRQNNDQSYNHYPNYNFTQQSPHANSMNSSHISFNSNVDKTMGRYKKTRKPLISKTTEVGGPDDYIVEDQVTTSKNWKQISNLNDSNEFQSSMNRSQTVEIETNNGPQDEGHELSRQLSRKKKNKRKANLVVMANNNIEEEIQIDDF